MRYALDEEGQRWVLKRDMVGCNTILSEAIGFELAMLLGIKAPRPALLSENGEYRWMTEFLPRVKHWHPDDRHLVENLNDVGGMLTLDIIVGNNDRHAGNILLQANDQTLTAFSIDLEDSWAGNPDDISARDAEDDLPAIPKGFARLVPLAELEAPMLAAAERCEGWTLALLGQQVQPWCNLLGESRGGAIIQGLYSRSQRAMRLAAARVRQIRSLQ